MCATDANFAISMHTLIISILKGRSEEIVSKNKTRCVNCHHPFTMGKDGIESPVGDLCDTCADVNRNPLDGTVISTHFTRQEEDSLTDMEAA